MNKREANEFFRSRANEKNMANRVKRADAEEVAEDLSEVCHEQLEECESPNCIISPACTPATPAG